MLDHSRSRRLPHLSVWLLQLWLISFMLSPSTITFGSSDQIIEQVPPAPQPATPPSPGFDQYDDQDDVEAAASPADPEPATPPTVNSKKLTPEGRKTPVDSSRRPSHEPYIGKEYRWRRFVIRPGQLKLEGFLLLTLVFYIYISYHGKKKNERAVADWLKIYSELLQNQFLHVGTGSPKGYIADGPALFYGYATGRKGCQSLTIRFALRPRQDIPFMIYEELRAAIDLSWTGRSDRLELVWALSPNNQQTAFESKDSFVWALVEKRVMNVIREDRWDVRMFTDVKESQELPPQLVFMSESGEITEQIVKSRRLDLFKFLENNSLSLKWFDSLILSGTPQQEPQISELPLPTAPSARTLTLRLRLPPPAQAMELLPLLQFCFDMIDSLVENLISPPLVTINKISKRRVEVSNLLLEEERKMEARAKEEKRRKQLKAAQDEKLAKMSPAEQRKHDERERKRNAAKIGKKNVKRK